MAVSIGRGASSLGLLFWLKRKLVWRHYCRQTSAAVGAILAIVFLVPAAVMAAFGCFVGFHAFTPANAEHLLRAVLLGAYVMWAMSPVLGYALTEDFDLSKLFLYPISPPMMLAGAIAGSVIDLGFLLLLPTLVVVLISFATGLIAFPLVLAALACFMFHAIALSQVVNLTAAGLLRSRRGRDVMAVLIPLLSILLYLASQSVPNMARGFDWSRVLNGRTWTVISYLPPGLAARAIGAASRGELVPALASLLAIAVIAGATLYLAGWLLQLAYAGEVGGFVRRRAAQAAAESIAAQPTIPSAAHGRRFRLNLPPAVLAVADKDFKYLVRDPFFKTALMQTVYMVVVFGFGVLRVSAYDDEGSGSFSQAVTWGSSSMLLLMQAQLSFNSFGPDGAAAATLFLFPSSRRHILIGKNLVLLGALALVNAAFVGIICALARQFQLYPQLIVWTTLATVIVIACGNLLSIRLPVRVVVRGFMTRSSSVGFTQLLVYLTAMLATALVSAPVLAALVVPTYWVSPLWFSLTIPLAGAYALGLYLLSLHMAANSLLEHEPEIAAKLAAQP